MKTKNYLLFLAVFLVSSLALAQNEEEGDMDGYVPFGALMSDVIDNVGQDRIDAVDRLFQAIDDNTTDPDYLSIPSAYFFKARELAFMGRYDEAKEIADKIREVSPTIVSNLLPTSRQYAYSMGYVTDGFVYWMQKDKPLAKTYFDSANQYFPDGFYANFFLGWIAQNEKENQKAIEYYTKAENGVTVMKYDWSEMYYRKGVVFEGMKLNNYAIEAYTKSIEKFTQCKAVFARGERYYFSAAYQDKTIAYDDFRVVVENCPSYKELGSAYSFLAEESYGKRNYQKALENYTKAFNLSGKYYDAGGAASAYYVLEDWSNAILWRTKAIVASGNDSRVTKTTLGEYYYWRAMSYVGLKKWGNTASDLRKAQSLGYQPAAEYLNKNADFFSKY